MVILHYTNREVEPGFRELWNIFGKIMHQEVECLCFKEGLGCSLLVLNIIYETSTQLSLDPNLVAYLGGSFYHDTLIQACVQASDVVPPMNIRGL